VTFNKKTGEYTVTSKTPLQWAILGSKKTPFPWSVLWIFLFVLAIIAGVFFFILRSQQKSKYNDYIRNKYYNL
jgi:ATP-dependent Zn protease